MQNIGLVFLAFAFVFAAISVRLQTVGTWSLLSLSIAFWIAAELIGGIARSGFIR